MTSGNFILHESSRPALLLPQTMLIKVKSAALNPSDAKVLSRLVMVPYLRWVLPQSPAFDVAGVVVETNCPERFPLNTRVFGNGLGGLQEYSVLFCNRAGRIPPKVSFNNAAASITPMYIAFAAMEGRIYESVVILGASGACGQAAIGAAKLRNVRNVICFTTTEAEDGNEFLFTKGCTKVYSSTVDLLEDWGDRVDLVLDTLSSLWNNALFPVLYHGLKNKGGRYLSPNLIFDQFVPWRRNFQLEMSPASNNTALAEHIKLMESTPQVFGWVDIAHTFKGFNLSHVSQGFSLVLSARGKIVFEME